METGDGWLLRVRRPGGVVTAAQLEAAADVSERWGRGIVEVTSRGNLQLRGIAGGAVDGAAAALVDAGLADPDPSRDARRGVVAPPLTGHDPAEVVDAGRLLAAVVDSLVTAALAPGLPPKFGVVVDTGGSIRVGAVPADLVLVAAGGGRWSAAVGHGPAARWTGYLVADGVDEVASLAVALAWRCSARRVRAADLPATDLDAVLGRHRRGPMRPVGTTATSASVGRWEHPEPGRLNVVAAPFLGRLAAAAVRQVAAAAARAAAVRLTPARCIALVGVQQSELEAVVTKLHAAGCSTDPADERHTVSACVGSHGCAAGRADTLAAATALAARRHPEPGPHEPVHLSGCEKGCGAPATGPVLVADAAGRFVPVRVPG